MRLSTKLLMAALVGFAALDLALGNPLQGQFFQGGKGGKGAGQLFEDPLALLRNVSVKKELKLAEDQSSKVNDAVWKALADVLNEEQLKRLKQIDLQVRGAAAFADPKVQVALKMDDDQKDDIKTILADGEKAIGEIFKDKGAFGAGGVNPLQKIQDMGRELKDKCVAVLKRNQKETWSEMIGEDFKLEMPGFGGFGTPDTKKKKKGGGGDN
jgi:hypothetical protein